MSVLFQLAGTISWNERTFSRQYCKTRLLSPPNGPTSMRNLITFLVITLLIAAVLVSPAWGQTPDGTKQSVLPDFDLRELIPSAETPQLRQSKALVDARRNSMEAFVAARQALSLIHI